MIRPDYARRVKSFWVFFAAGLVAACLAKMSPVTGAAAPLAATSAGTLPLLTENDLVYEGAFRMPRNIPGDIVDYSEGIIQYWEANNSLLVVGHGQNIAEISIPTPINNPNRQALNVATVRQPFVDVLQGKRGTVDGDPSNSAPIGGLLVNGNKLVVSVYRYYDGTGTHSKSHFVSGLDFSNLPAVQGPFQVGTFVTYPGGWVGGWMLPIPASLRSNFGNNTHFTGQCCVSVITRSSYGPSLTAFEPAKLGSEIPLQAKRVLGYDTAHPTVGTYESQYGAPDVLFHMSYKPGGVVIPDGSRSALFFARQGIGPNCYGPGTNDQAKAGTPAGGGFNWCYDPASSDQGAHAYPYVYQVAAYDVNELAAVFAGNKQFYQVKPYAKWQLTMQFGNHGAEIGGVAWDPVNKRIFVTARYGDVDQANYVFAPMVHVFKVQTPAGVCIY